MRSVRLAVVALSLACTLPAPAAPLSPPYDLFEVGPWPDERLETLVSFPGRWQVVYQERVRDETWILLGLPDRAPANEVAGERPRYLGRVRDGERVVITAPATASQERLETGRSLTVTPSGGTIAVTGEGPSRLARRSHSGFRALDQPLPVPRPRSPGPPARFGEILAKAEAGTGLRTAEDVRAVVNQVSSSRLERVVRSLSEEVSGAPGVRWWEDSATRGTHRDSIMIWLQDAGVDSVYAQPFSTNNDDGVSVQLVNIVGKIDSGIPGAGAVLLTAHMDATAARSTGLQLCADGIKSPASGCDCAAGSAAIQGNPACNWDADTDPSPGADDNATGIAALIEAARLLSPLAFDFDIYFVAFQAEEIGLVGSADFANHWVSQVGQEIFGVLNTDMLGYNASLNEVDVMTNESSEWLADWILQSGDQFVASLPIEKYVEFFARSDHASFWSHGIDAVLVLEDRDVRYPGYHRHTDVWDTIFPPSGRPNPELQLQLSVQLIVASMARLAVQYTVPDLSIPAGELTAMPASPSLGFVAGRDVQISAAVHNFGSSSLTFIGNTVDSLTARVTFYDGDPNVDGVPIGTVQQTRFFPSGGIVDFDLTWSTAGVSEGFHEIHAIVEGLDNGYAQLEVSSANNRGSTRFFLKGAEASGPRVLNHYVFPNPVRGTRDELTFYFELTRNAGVDLAVRDLEGLIVGTFSTGETSFFNGNVAGENRVSGDDIRWASAKVEPGVYLYTIELSQDGATTDRVRGKFAILR